MSDRTENLMDLDLNLGPVSPVSRVIVPEMGRSSGESVNLDDWVEPPLHHTIREALRQGTRQRLRWRHLQMPLEPHSLRMGVDSDGTSSDPGAGAGLGVEGEGGGGGGSLQTGEGSVAPQDRILEHVKTCENNVTLLENGLVNQKGDIDKSSTEEGSFFDCNICLDLARDPIVTCCGHLFCWPCIYRWLHIHAEAKECPVCKGEVTLKSVTPIYGRGNHTSEPDEELGIKIPVRPSARRVESIRQTIQRRASSFPVEEMIGRLGARFELARDFFSRDALAVERNTMLNRFLTSRGLRREQGPAPAPAPAPASAPAPAPAPVDVVDLTQDRPEVVAQRRLPPLTYRRGQSNRGLAALNERIFEAYIRSASPGQSQEHQPPLMDDRDSFSSITAVIHGESQTVDTAVEIDSVVSLSTSSSRRRNDASRTSDVDSGDSRSLRRRRLN